MNIQQKTEFIREKVIMSNNPECKTYEEALEKEAEHNSCQYKIIRGNEEIETGCGYWYSEYSSWDDVDREILGRPITLERLLVALQTTLKQQFAICGDFKCRVFWENNVQEIFSWQPNKTLEGQSEETIEKIYNILF